MFLDGSTVKPYRIAGLIELNNMPIFDRVHGNAKILLE